MPPTTTPRIVAGALMVGLAYNPPYELPSVPNDITFLKTTLQQYRGFNSFVGLQGFPTKEEILSKMTTFITGLKHGDRGVILLDGHGAPLAGNEPDGQHEVLVMSDAIHYIQDDEIGAILALAAPGVVLDVICSYCFSGGGTDNLNVRSWEASQADQTAWNGIYADGKAYSIFVHCLCMAMMTYPTATASQLIDVVREWVTDIVPSQVPQLEGPNQDQIPF
jgi:hypothetical protein